MTNKELSLQLAKILCEFKTQFSIKIDQKNSQGFSAVDYAKQKGNEPLEQFLESQIEEERTLSTKNSSHN